MIQTFQSPIRFYFFVWFFATLCAFAVSFIANAAQSEKRESAGEVRQILVQSLCLMEAYPDSAISRDAESVVAAYLDLLRPKLNSTKLSELKALAKAARPSRPSTVDQKNFAIANCILFANQKSVQRLIGN